VDATGQSGSNGCICGSLGRLCGKGMVECRAHRLAWGCNDRIRGIEGIQTALDGNGARGALIGRGFCFAVGEVVMGKS